jgi:HK97 gp10 family phage protein
MSRYAVTVTGIEDAERQMRAARDQLKEAAREGVFTTAKRAEARARSRVRVKSGLLAASIDTFMRKGAARARVGVHKKKPAARYAMALEFGTKKRPAYPYLLNSLNEERAGLVSDVSAALKRILK